MSVLQIKYHMICPARCPVLSPKLVPD